MTLRIEIATLLVIGLLAGRALYLRWRASLHRDIGPTPPLPGRIVDGADRTWVVFTTPYCATCGPVTAQLGDRDPSARVVTVDATLETELADALRIRSAPTAVLADSSGEVQVRLVGAEAVRDYFSARGTA